MGLGEPMTTCGMRVMASAWDLGKCRALLASFFTWNVT